jgi:hypothetical protein
MKKEVNFEYLFYVGVGFGYRRESESGSHLLVLPFFIFIWD